MFFKKLKSLKEKHLFRELKDRETPQGSRIRLNGTEYINFSSNDYLGLANHPYIIDKVKKALDTYGYGSSASRLLCGGSTLHKELENKIAEFKTTESALVFNSGYAANTGVIPAIADKDDVIFSDELNHASIIDGCRLSRSNVLIYKHKDLLHLKDLIRKEQAKKKIVVTDTVFSMEGDIAPIYEIYELCGENNVVLYIDDAHGTGVLGNGRGALSYFNIKPEPWIIQMGTFSKALGSYGAFLAGSSDVIQWTLNNARSFIFSTALPSCVIAASSELIKKLWENRNKAAIGIQKAGYDMLKSETPIIPIRTRNIENTLHVSEHLFKKGIFAPAIRPPAVKEPRIRITVTAAHSDEDIEKLIEALREV
jgi:8-amino-7-oxononanoate synthase